MSPINFKFRENWLSVIIIFLLTLIFCYPVIFQGKTFFAFDMLMKFLPWSAFNPHYQANNPLITDPINNHYLWHHFIVNCIQQKMLPLWSGSNFCGMPFATGYTPHTNPIVFLAYLIFPLTTAHDFVLGFHLCLSGIFMFLFLKAINLKTLAALIGSVSWMFKGYVMVFFEIESTVITASAFPAALFFIERWLRNRDRLNCLGFTCAIALSISSGYTHLIIFQILFIGIYLFYRIIYKQSSEGFKLDKRDLKNLIIMLLLGMLLSANFVTSHLPFLDDPQRSNLSFERLFHETGQLWSKSLITLIFPDLFGNPTDKLQYIPREITQIYNNYSELCIYSGILPLFLVVVCIPFIFKKDFVSFFMLTAFLTLTMAMGSYLYFPLARFIPGLNLSTPTRVLYLFGFSISVLTAIGADILIRDELKSKIMVISGWITIFAIAVSISLFMQTETGLKWVFAPPYDRWLQKNYTLFENYLKFTSPVITFPLIITSISFLVLAPILFAKQIQIKNCLFTIAFMVLATDLITFGMRYNTTTSKSLEFPSTQSIRFLQKDKSKFRIFFYGRFLHNSFAPFGIEDAGGYNSFYPKRYGEFLHLCQEGPDAPLPEKFSRWIKFNKFGSTLFDLINVKYLLLPTSFSNNMSKYKLVYNNEIKIFENKNVFPRVFFVKDYQYCNSRQAAYNALATSDRSALHQKVILETQPPDDFIRNKSKNETALKANIEIISYQPNRIEICASSEKKGFIVISDNYYPGWAAEIDGKDIEILRANYIMRAIPIKAGTHTIVLEFQPIAMIAGMGLTLAGWIVLFLLICFCLIKNSIQKRFVKPVE